MERLIYPLCALAGVGVAAGLLFAFGGSSGPDASQTSVPSGPSVMLSGVQGAPGDGNEALTAALRLMMAETTIAIVERPSRCTIAVTAEVSALTKASTEQISIVWQVHDADGRALGEVAQITEVPIGALDGDWGDDARHAAKGARAGVIDILRRPRAGCA